MPLSFGESQRVARRMTGPPPASRNQEQAQGVSSEEFEKQVAEAPKEEKAQLGATPSHLEGMVALPGGPGSDFIKKQYELSKKELETEADLAGKQLDIETKSFERETGVAQEQEAESLAARGLSGQIGAGATLKALSQERITSEEEKLSLSREQLDRKKSLEAERLDLNYQQALYNQLMSSGGGAGAGRGGGGGGPAYSSSFTSGTKGTRGTYELGTMGITIPGFTQEQIQLSANPEQAAQQLVSAYGRSGYENYFPAYMRSRENKVRKFLQQEQRRLLPDNEWGVPVNQARKTEQIPINPTSLRNTFGLSSISTPAKKVEAPALVLGQREPSGMISGGAPAITIDKSNIMQTLDVANSMFPGKAQEIEQARQSISKAKDMRGIMNAVGWLEKQDVPVMQLGAAVRDSVNTYNDYKAMGIEGITLGDIIYGNNDKIKTALDEHTADKKANRELLEFDYKERFKAQIEIDKDRIKKVNDLMIQMGVADPEEAFAILAGMKAGERNAKLLQWEKENLEYNALYAKLVDESANAAEKQRIKEIDNLKIQRAQYTWEKNPMLQEYFPFGITNIADVDVLTKHLQARFNMAFEEVKETKKEMGKSLETIQTEARKYAIDIVKSYAKEITELEMDLNTGVIEVDENTLAVLQRRAQAGKATEEEQRIAGTGRRPLTAEEKAGIENEIKNLKKKKELTYNSEYLWYSAQTNAAELKKSLELYQKEMRQGQSVPSGAPTAQGTQDIQAITGEAIVDDLTDQLGETKQLSDVEKEKNKEKLAQIKKKLEEDEQSLGDFELGDFDKFSRSRKDDQSSEQKLLKKKAD